MISYEHLFANFLEMMKVESISKKHWSDTLSWGMAKVMHKILLKAT